MMTELILSSFKGRELTLYYRPTTFASFVTETGLFGMNTYLYCLYHDIHLISCSITAATTHDMYETGFAP